MTASSPSWKCPACSSQNVTSKVLESRTYQRPVIGIHTTMKRRRRSCSVCDHRWTTWEIDDVVLQALVNNTEGRDYRNAQLGAIAQIANGLRDDIPLTTVEVSNGSK